MRPARYVLGLLFPLCACASVVAQVDTLPVAFRQLTIRDGLSQGMVSAIVQDRYGFMWFATKDGLDRYDGYGFTVYRHDPLDSTSLRDSHVMALHEDRLGRLWVGTNKGLDMFDPLTETFHHMPCDQIDGARSAVPDCPVMEIVEDRLGALWVATDHALSRITMTGTTIAAGMAIEVILREHISGLTMDRNGLLRANRDRDQACNTLVIDTSDPVNRGAVVHATGAPAPAAGTDPSAARCLILCADTLRGHVYGVHAEGVLELGRTAGLDRPVPIDAVPWAGAACTEVDAHGAIWISTMARLYRCDPASGRIAALVPTHCGQAIAMANVHCMYRDRNGSLWLGTKGHGVLSYDPRVERFHPQRSATMRWMLPLRSGKVLMIRGRWAYRYDPATHREEPAFSTRTAAFLNDQRGREPSLAQDSSGAVWINDQGALIRYDDRDGSTQRFTPLSNRVEFPLHLHGDSLISFAGDNALGWFDLRTHSFSTQPYPIPAVGGVYLFLQAIHHDAEGVVWLGTMKGLLRFDPRTQEWTHYASGVGDPHALVSDVIFSLLDDPREPRHFLWVGTNGGGLHRMDKRTGAFTHFGAREGLPNEVIYGLLADEGGHLWMSTNKGIACFDPVSGAVRCFDANDGLQGDEFNRYSFCRQADGTMFFGGVDGFSYFHPSELKSDTLPVQMSITDIRWMNQPVLFGQGHPLEHPARVARTVTLPYDARGMLTLEFASMDHGAVRERHYQYQLLGFDTGRMDAGTGRSATYTSLDPGEYTFKVWGRNRDGVWDREALSFQVIIAPPWYLTFWAKVLFVLVSIGALIGLDRLRARSLRQRWTREATRPSAN